MRALGPRRAPARGYTAVEVTVAWPCWPSAPAASSPAEDHAAEHDNARNISTANRSPSLDGAPARRRDDVEHPITAATWATPPGSGRRRRRRATGSCPPAPRQAARRGRTSRAATSIPAPAAWAHSAPTCAWCRCTEHDPRRGPVFWRRNGMPVACDTNPASIAPKATCTASSRSPPHLPHREPDMSGDAPVARRAARGFTLVELMVAMTPG